MTENKYHSVIHKMISVNRTHKKAIETVIDDIGVHRSRHHVLMSLAKKEKFNSQREMAEHFGVTQAAITVSLSKLESDGLIERKRGKDNRFNEISITEKGKKIVLASRAHFAEVDSKTFESFTDEELRIFEKCLDKMQANLEKNSSEEEKK